MILIVPYLLMLSCKEAKEPAKPNIIMVMCGQMRSDRFGAMGNAIVKTPNIGAWQVIQAKRHPE